jgi:integrase
MSRRAKGPRLWLRPARPDGTAAAWFILDDTRQRGTGLGAGASNAEKEKALNQYLTEKHTAGASVGSRDPSQILVDDVLAKYVRDVVAKSPQPYETTLRIKALRKFWGGKRLSEVTGDTCRAYAATRTEGAARRELEDFRAAINHHRREGLHDKIVSVVLPDKAPGKERWLTRDEAAHLILTAWRYREKQNFRATDRRTRRHVARFMVVARWMGSRAGVICGASIEPKRPKGRPWVDLKNGVFYGRSAGERQTKKRKQLVRLPLPLLAHLRRWRANGQHYAVEWNGEPIKRISKAHAAAVYDAELGSDVTPHTWRHSLATWLMQEGVDPFKAAGFIGMSVETLLRVYGHHHPDHSADVHRKRKAA